MESDPTGLYAGLNTYGYVAGNALSANDPLGLISSLDACALPQNAAACAAAGIGAAEVAGTAAAGAAEGTAACAAEAAAAGSDEAVLAAASTRIGAGLAGQEMAGATMLGTFPEYINAAEYLGTQYFDMAPAVYGELATMDAELAALGEEGGNVWAVNKAFLDAAIANGQTFLVNAAGEGKFLARELQYLADKGISYYHIMW